MLKSLSHFFEFSELKTNFRTEIMAGVTTFVTMAYIVIVNPSILSETGIPFGAAAIATCLSSALGCFLMGFIARYPIALAPGMGLNAYFTYSVCIGMHIPWQTALGAVFLSGIIFLLLTLVGVRQLILRSIPAGLYSAVAAGIGLFIALIGFHYAGIIVPNAATMVALGDLHHPGASLALLGLLLMILLEVKKVKGSILIGIVVLSLCAWGLGLLSPAQASLSLSQISATAFKLDLGSATRLGVVEIIFVFLFVDVFDNLGTLVAVTKRAGQMKEDHTIPRLNSILLADSIATIAGSLLGTSTVTSYVESTAGVAAGGRSGFTAIVTGICFLIALVTIPLVSVIPAFATAPALILVGGMMLRSVTEINWEDPLIAMPAFLTIVLIPLTYSIASGLGLGMIAYAVLLLASGKAKTKDIPLFVLASLFLAKVLI